MVVSSLIKNILPIAIVGLGLAFLYNVVAKPGQASQSASALSDTLSSFGTGIADVGTGIGSAFGSLGTGSAQLLNPLFTLKDLVYGDTASIVQSEQNITASNTTVLDPTPNSASDSFGVTPQAPASNTIPMNPPNFYPGRDSQGKSITISDGGTYTINANPNFPSSRPATPEEKSTLSRLTGGLLG
tara:strand:- start:1968 stop:2525 length:558 start_codon:yes stop_codon:yes gene_type:complete